MACEDSKKATILITHRGKTIRVESKKPGVDYTNNPSQDASGEDATCEWRLDLFRTFEQAIVPQNIRIKAGAQVTVQTPQDGGVDPNNGYPSFVLYADGVGIGSWYYPDEILDLTPVFLGSCTGNGYLVEVTDQSGRIFKKFFPGEQPEIEVICDDKCPQGQMKCKCDKYPGYCCLPCNGVVSKINNLAAGLKTK